MDFALKDVWKGLKKELELKLIMLEINKIYCGDCLELMHEIQDKSIDMVLADPPYGTTACKWDSVIPLAPMWEQIERIIKQNGAIVITSSQPFTSVLILSNLSLFKYEWIWDKSLPVGHLNAKKRPLKLHENICVFYKKQPTYNPLKTFGHNKKIARAVYKKHADGNSVYGAEERDTFYSSTERYPVSIQRFNGANQKNKTHPTQKPLSLMEYLIMTYTNKGDIVLDFAIGSGTTAVACINLHRNFIGIEKEQKYVDIANKRITQAEPQLF